MWIWLIGKHPWDCAQASSDTARAITEQCAQSGPDFEEGAGTGDMVVRKKEALRIKRVSPKNLFQAFGRSRPDALLLIPWSY
jgi:hypothetical protein